MNLSSQPTYICHDCGRNYLNKNDFVCTYHVGTCDVCGKDTSITHVRNYNWLKRERKVSTHSADGGSTPPASTIGKRHAR